MPGTAGPRDSDEGNTDVHEADDRERTEKAEETEKSDHNTSHRHAKKRTNPHKYLLYRPTASQLITFTSFAFKVLRVVVASFSSTLMRLQELQESNVMLVYLSADGHRLPEAASATLRDLHLHGQGRAGDSCGVMNILVLSIMSGGVAMCPRKVPSSAAASSAASTAGASAVECTDCIRAYQLRF